MHRLFGWSDIRSDPRHFAGSAALTLTSRFIYCITPPPAFPSYLYLVWTCILYCMTNGWPPGEVTSPATARSPPTFSPTTDTEHEGRSLSLFLPFSPFLSCRPMFLVFAFAWLVNFKQLPYYYFFYIVIEMLMVSSVVDLYFPLKKFWKSCVF